LGKAGGILGRGWGESGLGLLGRGRVKNEKRHKHKEAKSTQRKKGNENQQKKKKSNSGSRNRPTKERTRRRVISPTRGDGSGGIVTGLKRREVQIYPRKEKSIRKGGKGERKYIEKPKR